MFKNKDYVLAVYKEQSFVKAAKKLFVSQPSLSSSIKRIEQKIGSPIFDRSNSPITLTEVGEKYIEYALSIQQKEQAFEAFVLDVGNLNAGTIRIGGSSFYSSFVLPEMIANFNKTYPKVKFVVYEDNTKNLIAKLVGGEIDLVIDNFATDDDNIVAMPYAKENLLLIVPKSFEVNENLKEYRFTAEDIKNGKHLSSAKPVDIAKFSNSRFVLLNSENDSGKRAQKILKKHSVEYKVSFHLNQQLSAYNVCCTGLGIAFVSDTLIKKTDSSSEIFCYKIEDSLASRTINFYYKKNRYLSQVAKKFLNENTK